MIVRKMGSGAICIAQAAHASIAGQLARVWGNERFGVPAPREALQLAAERHDDGMRDFDRTPELDPATGLPYTYLTMRRDTHLGSWEEEMRTALERAPVQTLSFTLRPGPAV